MSLYLLGVSYLAMVLAGLAVGAVFQVLGLVHAHHFIAVFQTRPSWNYTTFLDFAALAVAAVLGWRFLRTGGPAMLRAMVAAPDDKAKLALDPVCGMSVDPATATARSDYDGKSYVFCSAGCKSAFDKDPDQFVSRAAQHRHPH